MRARTTILAAALLASVMLLAACSPAVTATPSPAPTPTSAPAESKAPDGEALVQERCTVCHTLGRVQNTGRTAEAWQTVVEEMVEKGAVLNTDEQAAVIKYLVETYPK